jgi:hypothetical protein
VRARDSVRNNGIREGRDRPSGQLSTTARGACMRACVRALSEMMTTCHERRRRHTAEGRRASALTSRPPARQPLPDRLGTSRAWAGRMVATFFHAAAPGLALTDRCVAGQFSSTGWGSGRTQAGQGPYQKQTVLHAEKPC